MIDDIFDGIEVGCCKGAYLDSMENPCVCPQAERVLRAYTREDPTLDAMGIVEREWCLSEIDRVEGYRREDYTTVEDAALAGGVLDAWRDFARDKGLL